MTNIHIKYFRIHPKLLPIALKAGITPCSEEINKET